MRGARPVLLAMAVLGCAGTEAAAEPPRLAQPVACTVGADCFVQNYVDHDPGPGFADFTCGRLGYDGHPGTDIRLPTLAEMRAGVPVLAAAAGIVLRLRDGMADVSTDEIGREAVAGREAGNSVIIDHGDGWQTQYSHMMRGSIAVEPGQPVEAGQQLGLIGLSGDTEFPHLHFELRHNGETIDPYVGPGVAERCGQGGTPLWDEAAASALAYRPTALLAAGFAAEAPSYERTLAGAYAGEDTLPTTASPALVFWTYLMGTQEGDQLWFSLTGPDGAVVAETTQGMSGPKADFMGFVGRKKRGDAWPAGPYLGRFTLTRMVEGKPTVIVDTTREIQLR